MTTPTDTQTANNGAAAAEQTGAPVSVTSSAPASQSPGSDLSSLLKEYEKATPTPITTADFSRFVKTIEPIVTHVQDDARNRAEEAEKTFTAESVKTARGDNIPEEKAPIVEAWLRHRVQTDPKVFDTWENRSKNPDGWKQFLTQANGELAPVLGSQTTNDVRTDVERAAAAVRNVSTDPPRFERPSPTEALNMNDRDWAIYKAKREAANQSG